MLLSDSDYFAECKSQLRELIPLERGDRASCARWLYASVTVQDGDSSVDDLRDAVATLTDLEAKRLRIFGEAHPDTRRLRRSLESAQKALAARVAAAASEEESA